MVFRVPTVNPNFSNSNSLINTSNSFINTAGSLFGDVIRQRQRKEELEQQKLRDRITKQQNQQRIDESKKSRLQRQSQFDRTQDFAEGADARALAREETIFKRNRNRVTADNAIVTETLGSLDFSFDPNNLQAIRNDPRYQELDEQSKIEFENSLRNNVQNNISLFADPINQIVKPIEAEGRARGLNNEQISNLVKQGLSSFQTMNPEIAKTLLEQQNKREQNLLKVFGNQSGTGSVTGTSSRGRIRSADDSNARENSEFFTKYLEDNNADLGKASWVTRTLDWMNVFNDTDITRANVTPLLKALEASGVRAPAALSALEGLGYIIDGEFDNSLLDNKSTANEILGNKEEFNTLLSTAQSIQNTNTLGNSNGNTGLIGDNLQIFKNILNEGEDRTNQILSSLSPKQTSAEGRLKLYFQALEQRTGKKLEDLDLSNRDKKEITDSLIAVEEDVPVNNSVFQSVNTGSTVQTIRHLEKKIASESSPILKSYYQQKLNELQSDEI